MSRAYGAEDLKGKKVFDKDGKQKSPWDKPKPKEKPTPKPEVKASPPPAIVQVGMSAEDGMKIVNAATAATSALIESAQETARVNAIALSIIEQIKASPPPTTHHRIKYLDAKVTSRTQNNLLKGVRITLTYEKQPTKT